MTTRIMLLVPWQGSRDHLMQTTSISFYVGASHAGVLARTLPRCSWLEHRWYPLALVTGTCATTVGRTPKTAKSYSIFFTATTSRKVELLMRYPNRMYILSTYSKVSQKRYKMQCGSFRLLQDAQAMQAKLHFKGSAPG